MIASAPLNDDGQRYGDTLDQDQEMICDDSGEPNDENVSMMERVSTEADRCGNREECSLYEGFVDRSAPILGSAGQCRERRVVSAHRRGLPLTGKYGLRLLGWYQSASKPSKAAALILAVSLGASIAVVLYALSGTSSRAGRTFGSLLSQGQSLFDTQAPSGSPSSFPSSMPSSRPSVSSPPSYQPSAPPSTNPTSSPTAKPVIFYVTGDAPYSSSEAKRLKRDLLRIPSDAQFIAHVGDMNKAKDTNCTENTFSDVKDILKKCKYPVFIIPGDNDVFDCPDEDKAWKYWRRHLLYLDKNWDHSIRVKRQSDRKENFAFVVDGVLFVGVNLVEGPGGGSTERKGRRKDNSKWTLQKLEEYGEDIAGVVIFAHTNPDGDFKKKVGKEIEKLGLPALYIHGNGHTWEYEKDAFNVDGMIRVQVDNGGSSPPVRVEFRAGNRKKPFDFDRRR